MLTKESSIAKILQFSVIIQVQERLPGQSNPSHEQSTLKLLISGFNKNLPKKESKFTMWTLKIKLLISLPQFLRGNCLKNLRQDSDWYHQRKCDLSPIISLFFLTCCTILRGGQLRNWVSRFWYKILSGHGCLKHFPFKIATSDFWKTKFIQSVNPASDPDLEEGVNEKQHHESQDGVLFTLQI